MVVAVIVLASLLLAEVIVLVALRVRYLLKEQQRWQSGDLHRRFNDIINSINWNDDNEVK